MTRILIAIILSLCAMPLLADGWVSREGRNSLGENISWDMDDWRKPSTDNDNHHYVWASVRISVKGKQIKVFERQPCESINAPIPMLICDATGTSPLAGTKYSGKLVNGSCEKGDPEIRYLCIEGCKNPRAPKVLTKGHWEC